MLKNKYYLGTLPRRERTQGNKSIIKVPCCICEKCRIVLKKAHHRHLTHNQVKENVS